MLSRRRFVSSLASTAMFTALAGAYGTLAAFMARFLYPARARRMDWMFVATLSDIAEGSSIVYRTPAGAPVNVARRSPETTADAFVAFSSTCPHLGCQVHWEAHNGRFFCPCHNGVFTPEGKAIEGPPAKDKQSLIRYDLKVEGPLLYLRVPLERLAVGKDSVKPPFRI